MSIIGLTGQSNLRFQTHECLALSILPPCKAHIYILGCIILFNPLVAPPCNGIISWIEVDHLLQTSWCQTTIYYSIIQILLLCFTLFYLIVLLNVKKNKELYANYITGFTPARYYPDIMVPYLSFKGIAHKYRR